MRGSDRRDAFADDEAFGPGMYEHDGGGGARFSNARGVTAGGRAVISSAYAAAGPGQAPEYRSTLSGGAARRAGPSNAPRWQSEDDGALQGSGARRQSIALQRQIDDDLAEIEGRRQGRNVHDDQYDGSAGASGYRSGYGAANPVAAAVSASISSPMPSINAMSSSAAYSSRQDRDRGHDDHRPQQQQLQGLPMSNAVVKSAYEARAGRLDMPGTPLRMAGQLRSAQDSHGMPLRSSDAYRESNGYTSAEGGGPAVRRSAAGYFVPAAPLPAGSFRAPSSAVHSNIDGYRNTFGANYGNRGVSINDGAYRDWRLATGGAGVVGVSSRAGSITGSGVSTGFHAPRSLLEEQVEAAVREIMGGSGGNVNGPSGDKQRQRAGYQFGTRPPAEGAGTSAANSFVSGNGDSGRRRPRIGSGKDADNEHDAEADADGKIEVHDYDEGSIGSGAGSRDGRKLSSKPQPTSAVDTPQSKAAASRTPSASGAASVRDAVPEHDKEPSNATEARPRFLPPELADAEPAPPALADHLFKLVDRLVLYRERLSTEMQRRKRVEERIAVLVDILHRQRAEIADLEQVHLEAAESVALEALAAQQRAAEAAGDVEITAAEHEDAQDMLLVKLQVDVAKNAAILARAARAKENEDRLARDDARRKMLTGVGYLDGSGDGGDGSIYGDEEEVAALPPLVRARILFMRFMAFLQRFIPFAKTVRRIDAFYGSTTGSYFSFFAWTVRMQLLIAFIVFCFSFDHWNRGNIRASEFVGSSFPQAIMPSSYVPAEVLYVTGQQLLAFALLLVLALRRWVLSDLTSKAGAALEAADANSGRTSIGAQSQQTNSITGASSSTSRYIYARLAFSAIDFRIRSTTGAVEAKAALGEQLSLALHEEILGELIAGRTFQQRAVLLARRVFGVLLSIGVQLWVLYLIAQLIIYSGELQTDMLAAASTSPALSFLSPLVPSLVPLAIALLNSALPTILVVISTLEAWDSHGTYTTALTLRLYIAQTASSLLQVLAFAQLYDPTLNAAPSPWITSWIPGIASHSQSDSTVALKIRAATARPFTPSIFSCRADAAAAGLLQLLVSQFVITKLTGLSMPLIAVLQYRLKHLIFGRSIAKAREKERERQRQSTKGVRSPSVDGGSSNRSVEGTPGSKRGVCSSPPQQQQQQQRRESLSENRLAEVVGINGGANNPVVEAAVSIDGSNAISTSKTSIELPPSVAKPLPSPVISRINPVWPPLPPLRTLYAPEHSAAVSATRTLYFTQLSLLSFSYCPLGSFLSAIFAVVEFYWESWYLQTIMRKPRRPWAAHAAMPLFMQLFLGSLAIAAAANILLLGSTTIPKQCGSVSDTANVNAFGSIPWIHSTDSYEPYCTAMSDVFPAYAALHGWKRGMNLPEIVSPYYAAAIDMVRTGSVESQRRKMLTTYVGEEVGWWLDNVCVSQCTTARAKLVSNASATSPGDVIADPNWCTSHCSGATAIVLDCGNTKGGPKFVDSWSYGGVDAGWQPIDPSVGSIAWQNPSVFVAANVTRPCSMAGGPFIAVQSGVDALKSYMLAASTLFAALYNAAHTPGVLWFLCIGLCMAAYLQLNTTRVARGVAEEREEGLRSAITTLDNNVKTLRRRLHVYSTTTGGGAGAANSSGIPTGRANGTANGLRHRSVSKQL